MYVQVCAACTCGMTLSDSNERQEAATCSSTARCVLRVVLSVVIFLVGHVRMQDMSDFRKEKQNEHLPPFEG